MTRSLRTPHLALAIAALLAGCGAETGSALLDGFDATTDAAGAADLPRATDAAADASATDTSSADSDDAEPPTQNACGGTAPLLIDDAPAIPGAACGPCEDGNIACASRNAVVCVGASALNGCGACGDLTVGGATTEAAPGESCGECSSWVCDEGGVNALSCVEDLANACGGCGPLLFDGLEAAPGAPCGPCADGQLVCVDTLTLACEAPGPLNACGGCGPIDMPLGEPCGACGVAVCSDGADACAGELCAPSWELLPTDWAVTDGVDDATFGRAVAISDLYVAVGADRSSAGGLEMSGRVYVAEWDGAAWERTDVVTPADPRALQRFGAAVALAGEWLIVGAPNDDTAGTKAGAVYAFRRDSTGWAQRDKLISPEPADLDRFGAAIAFDGATLVVGAPGADVEGASGSAFVFDLVDGAWIYATALDAADPPPTHYGRAVAVRGDRVAVGANADTARLPSAVHLFQRGDGTEWTRLAMITGAGNDGTSVGFAADDVAVIGRPGDATLALFDIATDTLRSVLVPPMAPPEGGPWPWDSTSTTGWSLAARPARIVAGSLGSSWAGERAGASVVFERAGAGWVATRVLQATDAGPHDAFGISVAAFGRWAVVGATSHDHAGEHAGAAYLYDLGNPDE